MASATSAQHADLGSGARGARPAMPLMPSKQWTPRQQLQNLNDFLSLGPLDRWEFWTNFVASFWSGDAMVGLRVRLGQDEVDGVFEVPPAVLPHFFHTWAGSGSMRRLYFDLIQATEGSPHPSTLNASQGCIESILLEGALLVRQHARIRCTFDQLGRVSLLDLHIISHDEFVLSAVAGQVIATNGLSICRYGFPMSVHRVLEMAVVVREMFGETPDTPESTTWTTMNGPTKMTKKKRKSPTSDL